MLVPDENPDENSDENSDENADTQQEQKIERLMLKFSTKTWYVRDQMYQQSGRIGIPLEDLSLMYIEQVFWTIEGIGADGQECKVVDLIINSEAKSNEFYSDVFTKGYTSIDKSYKDDAFNRENKIEAKMIEEE